MRILIALDGSTFAGAAFNWYFDNLHVEGNEIILGHVTEQLSLPLGFRASQSVQMEALMKDQEKKTNDIKERFTSILKKKGVEHKFITDQGEPGHGIMHIAVAEQCQMIVLGTRGLGTVRRTILGSVSDYVLHHAHVPVAICHQQ